MTQLMTPPVPAAERAPETAAQYLDTRVPLALPHETVGSVIHKLPAQLNHVTNAVYVVDAAGAFQGLVPLATLLTEERDRLIGELVETGAPRVRPNDDQEQVAHAALHHGVIAVPVVDEQNRLLGVVPARSLLEILHREHVEDLHRLAGIMREQGWARSALESPPRRLVWHRLPWLLVGLVGSAAATFVMSRFEHALQARVAIAFFVPGIVYLADAIGTQTEAVAVRGLSLSRASLRHLVLHELSTGFLIGLALAAVAFPAVALTFGDLNLALAVSVALTSAGAVAGGLGLLMPWALDRLGLDPAFGSGPVATILQDILSLLIYFGVAELLVA